MDTKLRSWAIDRPVTSPFALPRGMFGRLAGRIMLWTNKQDEILSALEVGAGEQVLEVGCGPGGLIRLLVGSTDAARVYGVDPSAQMCAAAARLVREAV